MGIFPDDLEQVYDRVIEHKLRRTGLEVATPKLIKDNAGTMQIGLPVILCQICSSLLWKQ